MTWPWRTFSSLVCAVGLYGGSVVGRVELLDSRDPAVRKHRDYSGVVVWLDPLGQEPPTAPPRTVAMVQKGKRFIPHVLAVPVGATVEFPNLDPIFHNAFSNFSGQPFDTGLYPPGTSQKVRFRREGIVRVFCNIHSTMSAVIVVTRTPFVAVTDREGVFRIQAVPAGEYRLRVWHERATEGTLKALERKIVVGENGGEIHLPALRISESGFLEVPHKNKYGQDYPPVPEEHVVYPGVRR
jgi:plastocyanin